MTVYVRDTDFTLHHGDALDVLPTLPDASVHCCVTSPPYWGLRDYGVTGQLGLEQTPDEYVARMVQVFREVRRVLRDDGTLWLNLGDSYANTGFNSDRQTNGGFTGAAMRRSREYSSTVSPPKQIPEGIKPKDLVGIPWRVAFALQQPYYAGRIKDERDRIWLAAMVDAEGCIHIHKRSAGAKAHSTFEKADGTVSEYVRKNDTYGVMVSIDNTSQAIIDRIEAIVGQGSRYTHEKGVGKSNRKQTLYRITLTGQQSRELLREIYPHLVAKQREARIAYHSPSSGNDAVVCHEAIKALHNGEDTTVDKPVPPTLFEPGWYLRSDVIWGKPNPMPESVTDRPTKAHEYVFLLTKQPRYWFDQEAVREKSLRAGDIPGGNNDRGRGEFGISPHAAFNGPVPANRNVRTVWEIATQPYAEAHFATYPQELVRRCLLAGCPEWVCGTCGKARERIVECRPAPANESPAPSSVKAGLKHVYGQGRRGRGTSMSNDPRFRTPGGGKTVGWLDCGCGKVAGSVDAAGTDACDAENPAPRSNYRPGTVLDPFMGSGTTALVARNHNRRSIGIELNRDYCELAARRLSQQSLLAGDAA